MHVYFLGTGTSQGIPIIGSNHSVCKSTNSKDKRLRVSVLITWEHYSYLIDCGPDFRQQMLASNCQKIDGILYTHEHSDHTAGLDDIRPFFFKQGEIPIYAHQRVIENLKIRFDYIFETENKYPGAPSVKTIEVVNNHPFSIGNKTAIPINVMHGNLQVFGYRIDDFAYLTDVSDVPFASRTLLKGLDVLVLDGLRERPHPMHLTIDKSVQIANEIGAKQTWFTHIAHDLTHEEIELRMPAGMAPAYDGLHFKTS